MFIKLNKIYHGDCLEVMKEIDDNSIDMIATDPPYIMNYKTRYRKDKNHNFCKTICNDDNENIIKDSIPEFFRVLKDNSSLYMFCNQNKIDLFKQEIEKYFKIKNIIIWVKNNWTAGDLQCQYGKQYEFIIYANKGRRLINGKRITDVWNYSRVNYLKLKHQNEKPVSLIEKILYKSSNDNNIILDPFFGSGTTAIACINTNRNFIGIEIEKKYIDIANQRIKEAKLSKKKKFFKIKF